MYYLFVFEGNNVTIKRATIETVVFGSDHCPVTLTLEFYRQCSVQLALGVSHCAALAQVCVGARANLGKCAYLQVPKVAKGAKIRGK